MSLIMKVNGILGEATGKGFEGGILLHHLQNVSGRPVSQRSGVNNQDIGMMSIDHILVTKSHDAASLKLAQHLFSGTAIPKVEITQYNLTNGKAEWKYKITLSNVRISSIEELSDEHGGSEQLMLAFSKIEKSYRSQKGSGQYGTPSHTGFDLPTAVVS